MLKLPKLKSYNGTIKIQGDKSIGHRAFIISALANGTSRIYNSPKSMDLLSTMSCLESLGIEMTHNIDFIEVRGVNKNNFRASKNILNANNSGSTIRMLSGILSAQNFSTTITGDESLQSRPMMRIIEPLKLMGADIISKHNYAPLTFIPVKNLNGINYKLKIPSAQVKSALIFAGMFAEGETSVSENILTRNHTENILGLKTEITNDGFKTTVNNKFNFPSLKNFIIPNDPSSAAFVIALSILSSKSEITIPNVCINPTRIKFIEVLKSIGANINFINVRDNYREPVADIVVKSSVIFGDMIINEDMLPSLIDEIPILAVISLFKNGIFKLTGAKELRVKESDRISAVCFNLRKLGVEVDEYEDGFAFEGLDSYKGVEFSSFNDHRIAMAFAIAGMKIGNSSIDNEEIANISFPTFFDIVKLFSE